MQLDPRSEGVALFSSGDYPAIYQAASTLAANSQNAYFRSLIGHLVLLAIAAILSMCEASKTSAIIQALALLGALSFALHLYLVRPEKNWYSARAIAESIKTLTWRYVTKSEPFDGSDDVDRKHLTEKLQSVLEQNTAIAGLLTTHLSGAQITQKMALIRGYSTSDRLKVYVKNRVIDQQNWYADNASKSMANADTYYKILIGTICLAIICAVMKVAFLTLLLPVDVLVTVAAGLLAWIQAKRYQELSASYALAAHEIGFIREQAGAVVTDKELSDFVGDSENAFSREHTQWIARKDH